MASGWLYNIKLQLYRLLRTQRWKHVRRYLDPQSHSLLDIGCQELYFYKRLSATYEVTAADYEPRHPEVIQEDVQQLTFADKTFDIVLCQQVLEHVPDPVKAINELQRVCRRQLIITVPYEPFFTLARLGMWEKQHLWAITPMALRHHLGKPAHEDKILCKRYYLGVWNYSDF